MMHRVFLTLTVLFTLATSIALPASIPNQSQIPDLLDYPTVYTSVWSRTVTDIHTPRIGDYIQQTVTYLITTTATDYLSFAQQPTALPCTVFKTGVSTQVGSTFIHPTYTHGRTTTYTRVEKTVLERLPEVTEAPVVVRDT